MQGQRLRTAIVLAFAVAMAGTGDAQTSAAPDTQAFAGWKIGRLIRITGQLGRRSGTFLGARYGSLWFNTQPATAVPLAGIDSVWVGRRYSKAGALVGMVVGALIARSVINHQTCAGSISDCIGSSTGTFFLGAFAGAVIGSGIKSWSLVYPSLRVQLGARRHCLTIS